MPEKIDYSGLNPEAVSVIRLLPPIKNIKALRAGADIRTFTGSRNVFAKKFKMQANGKKITCKLYYPLKKAERCIVYFHGGSFLFGGINNPDGAMRDWCNESRDMIISVKYSLAPEFPYPNAINECFSITKQIFSGADKLSIKQIFLAGDSAGGNLAIVTAMRLGEIGLKVSGLILFYPLLEQMNSRLDKKYPSLKKYEKGFFLETEDLDRMTNYYVPSHIDLTDPPVSPIYGDLKLLPKTIILSAGFDPLIDMSRYFKDKLDENNIPNKLVVYDDIIHGFFTIFKDYAKMAIDEIINFFVE